MHENVNGHGHFTIAHVKNITWTPDNQHVDFYIIWKMGIGT